MSAGSLLYHFHSKEDLTIEILSHVGNRQRVLFENMRVHEDASSGDVCRAVWRVLGAPESRPIFRLFFEVYGLALVDRVRFPDFFPAAVHVWLDFLETPFVREGMTRENARVRATIVLATFRGFLLDVCGTNETARVDAAVAAWIASWI